MGTNQFQTIALVDYLEMIENENIVAKVQNKIQISLNEFMTNQGKNETNANLLEMLLS